MLLEVIVQSAADARAAAAGGADRLEVVRRIDIGGLTPSLSLVRDIQNATSLPLRVMVRANAGYSTTPDELLQLCHDAEELTLLGVDGLVVGFARDGEPEMGELGRVLKAAPGVNVTFHRAFDQLRAPLEAIEALAALPQIDRILTSGGDGTPEERSTRLGGLTRRARGRLVVIAGGGVDEAALRTFSADGCVTEAHVGRAARDDGDPNAPVSETRVRQLRQLIDEANGA